MTTSEKKEDHPEADQFQNGSDKKESVHRRKALGQPQGLKGEGIHSNRALDAREDL